jgi:hypothetical protein
MNDSTGEGWLQHLIHGTSQALVASGPLACVSGPCRRFFTESKIFEVCRAIVFNQPTFLAEEKWMALSASLRASSTSRSQKALDALLDIVVMCASLRVKYVMEPSLNGIFLTHHRAANLIQSFQSLGPFGLVERAQAISLQGFELRGQLHSWASTHHTSNVFLHPPVSQAAPAGSNPECEYGVQLLAETFFSATSIYLSGVFDYEICHWQSLQLPAPTLTENEIQQHVASILTLSQRLAETTISPLLLLFPLRVGSARAREASQKQRIMTLFETIRSSFAVAGTFMADIEELWSYNSSKGIRRTVSTGSTLKSVGR